MSGYTIIGFDAEDYAEPVPVKVDQRYDRNIRSWVTTLVDADGAQVGDALFDGERKGAAASKATMQRRLDGIAK